MVSNLFIKNYCTATQYQVLPFQNNNTLRFTDATVVVGSNEPEKLAPQAIVRGVPSSVIEIQSLSAVFGVPLKLVVNDVMFAASAVIE